MCDLWHTKRSSIENRFRFNRRISFLNETRWILNANTILSSIILFLTFFSLEYRWDYVSRCADCFSFHLSSKRKIQGHEIISPGEGWIIHKTPRPPVDLSFIKRLALKTGRIEENETLSLKYIYIFVEIIWTKYKMIHSTFHFFFFFNLDKI